MQVQKTRTAPARKPGVAARSVSKATAQSQSGSKDVNSSLIQRALDLVHDGQLTSGVAIKLFGIPRSTFYKKLQARSTPDFQPDQQYQAEGDFQSDFANGSGDTGDGFVGTADGADAGMSAGQWSNYVDYYTA